MNRARLPLRKPSCFLALLACLVAAPSSAPAQPVFAIDRDSANVRDDATTRARRIAVLVRGDQVVELRRHERWVQVRLPGGISGWIHADLLLPCLVVEGEGVRLREGPSVSSKSLTMVFRGQEVVRLRRQSGWSDVRLQDGRLGWMADSYLRGKTAADLAAQRPAESAAARPPIRAAEAPPAPVPAAEGDIEPESDPAILARNPYAEGLQLEASGDYAGALERFEEVLAGDPDHGNALFHAAQAHRRLGEYDEALDRLYRALAGGGGRRDLHLMLGEVYRQKSMPDSAAKYQALFRGDADEEATPTAAVGQPREELPWPGSTDSPTAGDAGEAASSAEAAEAEAAAAAEEEEEVVVSSLARAPWLLIGMALVGVLALAGVAWWLASTSSGGARAERRAQAGGVLPAVGGADRARFERIWREEAAEARQGRATLEEEAELDRQIDAKWQELKDSADLFSPPGSVSRSGEVEGVDRVLDQVEGLRRTLEGQDERARLYADIVRLQNMKIDAMTEEIRRLRGRKS